MMVSGVTKKGLLVVLGVLFIFAGLAAYVSIIGITPDLNFPTRFTYYEHTGAMTYTERRIGPGDELYDNLKQWLDNNREGWKFTAGTYMPIQLFHSSDLSINVFENRVVINYAPIQGGRRHFQVYRDIDSVESVLGRNRPQTQTQTCPHTRDT